MRTICLLSLLICIVSPVRSQQRLVSCSSERNADGTVSIYADCKGFVDYTVKLNFKVLVGYNSNLMNGEITTVNGGKTQIAKLTPDKNATQQSFNYSYQYFAGRFLSKAPDTTFVYLLPSTVGNTIRKIRVSSLQERITQDRPEDFHTVGFKYKLGDTICAARAGVVFETLDDQKTGETISQTYNIHRNKVAVAHNDGTLAYYTILAPVKLLVQPGEKVIPGQPMAVFLTESDKYDVLFSVHFLDGKKLRNSEADPVTPSYYTGIPTFFYIGDNEQSVVLMNNKEYRVLSDKDIVCKELSKKEKKRLGFN